MHGECWQALSQECGVAAGRTGSTASDTGASAVLTMWLPGSSVTLKAHCGAGTPSTATRAGMAGAAPPEPARATLFWASCVYFCYLSALRDAETDALAGNACTPV